LYGIFNPNCRVYSVAISSFQRLKSVFNFEVIVIYMKYWIYILNLILITSLPMVLIACNGESLSASIKNQPGQNNQDQNIPGINYSDLTYNWVALNDSSELSTGNTTSFGLINSSSSSGLLVKNVDNSSTGITATLSGNNLAAWDLDTSPSSGTDAFDLFNGKINLSGIASYDSSSADWFYQLELTGLSTTKTYAILFYLNRDNIAYSGTSSAARWSLFTLSENDTGTYINGGSIEKITENQLKINSGYNTVNGSLVGWSKVKTSSGKITIKSENMGLAGPGERYKSYGFQAFALMEIQ
jgi:hypothetical protein